MPKVILFNFSFSKHRELKRKRTAEWSEVKWICVKIARRMWPHLSQVSMLSSYRHMAIAKWGYPINSKSPQGSHHPRTPPPHAKPIFSASQCLSMQLMCWAQFNCSRYDPVWLVGEFLRVICSGWRDILWAVNQRFASQWEGIQNNCPVGLRRYEPSISTAGKAADLILLMCYRMLNSEFVSVSLFLYLRLEAVRLGYVLLDKL